MKTIIVAGIGRSGLTMTMQMLDAGGFKCTGNYPAYEPYHLGGIPFKECMGTAIKSIDTHLQYPPVGEYYVIRLKRDMKQQSKSMGKLLRILMGVSVTREDVKNMRKNLPDEYAQIDRWVINQHKSIILNFEEILSDPKKTAEQIAEFIGEDLNIEKMANVVVDRSPKCYDGLLEAKMV